MSNGMGQCSGAKEGNLGGIALVIAGSAEAVGNFAAHRKSFLNDHGLSVVM